MAVTTPPPPFRLQLDLVPKHYDLDIITNLEPDNFSFEGTVLIKVNCVKSTNTIKVHARDLTFANEKVSVREAIAGEGVGIENLQIDSVNEFFVIKTKESLKAEQTYNIFLPFKGQLTEDLIGYYRSSYFDHGSNSTKWLTVTHFEPSDARQAFPCFDEPGLKATFTIRLAHKDIYKAASNMPLKKTIAFEGRAGWVWDEFETTVPMSTYIIAYMVSEFDYLQKDPDQSSSTSHVLFRVWARRDAIHQADFASQVGPHFLSFYERFFNVPYPLPKQDLLAIPDFKIGAMENWGIITFRETALLLDNKLTSSGAKLAIANVIAHELAHMWFGNLVTMKWWTDLWLKEGFATYMASLSVHHDSPSQGITVPLCDYLVPQRSCQQGDPPWWELHFPSVRLEAGRRGFCYFDLEMHKFLYKEFPEWNSLDASALDDLMNVFSLDSLKSSHPVSVPIGHPREISQIFDAISYDKGSFLLRMMSLFLGEEVFRQGVSAYLKKHEFSNAEQDDLWHSLTEQAHKCKVLPPNLSVKEIMDTWTLQTGYPVLTVTRNYENNKVSVSQKRFLKVKSDDPQDYKGSWWVPLSYSTSKHPQFDKTQPQHWLSKSSNSMEMPVEAEKGEWLILNNRAAGLYRVNYDAENWSLLSSTLNSENYKDISVLNRAQLLVDAMDLAQMGDLSYHLAFRVMTYLRNEHEYLPWKAGLEKLEPVRAVLSRTANYGIFKKYLKYLLTPIVESRGQLTEQPSSFEGGRLQSIVTQWACDFDVSSCRDQASKLYSQWSSSANPDVENPISKDVRRTVYINAARHGGEQVWEFLWQRFKNANLSTERDNVMVALTATQEIWLLNRLLEWSLDENSGIRKQDAFRVFIMVASKDAGFYVAEKFFYTNVKRISNYYGAKSNIIGRYFSSLAQQIIHSNELESLKQFAEAHKELLAPASLAVSQAIESTQANIKWVENHYATISTVLQEITPP